MLMWMLLALSQAQAEKCYPKNIDRPMYSGGRLELKYISREQAVRDEQEKAKRELREPVPPEAMPPGGFLLVTIEGQTLKHAKPSNYVWAVFDAEGDIIAREDGQDRGIPRPAPGASTFWLDVMSGSVPASIETWPVEIHVIDKLRQAKCVWSVAQDSSTTIVKWWKKPKKKKK